MCQYMYNEWDVGHMETAEGMWKYIGIFKSLCLYVNTIVQEDWLNNMVIRENTDLNMQGNV